MSTVGWIPWSRALSWAEHTTETTTKTMKDFLAMKPEASTDVSQMIHLILYQPLVLSVIDYGFSLMTLADTHPK